jgi:superfamily I DNA and/or RNA helicase
VQVFIETVDSFQGKQLDVVILSCVRAGNSGGLGFVTDIRYALQGKQQCIAIIT